MIGFLPVFSLLLGVLIIGGAYIAAVVRVAPPSETFGESKNAEPLSLWTECGVYRGDYYDPDAARKAAAEAKAEAAGEFTFPYEEIVFDEDDVRVYRVKGRRYTALLTVVKDSRRVVAGTLPYFGAYGMTLQQMVEAENALLGVNGGGFSDPNGEGSGGVPLGIVIKDGVMLWGGEYGMYDVCAFDGDGRLIVGNRTGIELMERGVQSAISYGPALIVEGEMQDSPVNQLEPRTAVGQRGDGTVLILNVEGRQVGSLGVSLNELAQIMADYGCVNATNLDGGASSTLFSAPDGELLNRPNGLAGMRAIPTCLLVLRSQGEDSE